MKRSGKIGAVPAGPRLHHREDGADAAMEHDGDGMPIVARMRTTTSVRGARAAPRTRSRRAEAD